MATNGITMMPIIVLVSVLSSIGAEYVIEECTMTLTVLGESVKKISLFQRATLTMCYPVLRMRRFFFLNTSKLMSEITSVT